MKKNGNMMSKAKSERVFASLGTFVTFGYKSKVVDSGTLDSCLRRNDRNDN
jgi:hypothetical protein